MNHDPRVGSERVEAYWLLPQATAELLRNMERRQRLTDVSIIAAVFINAGLLCVISTKLLLDQAGWHMTPQLVVSANISIIPLPAKCPELNPQENVWEFMRDNWLYNRIFTCYDNLVDHCCDAWNKLVQLT